MAVTWEKDLNSPRFMLSGFLANLNNTVNTLRSNKQMLVFVCISGLCESSIMIFTFYWAPWMALIAQETDQHLPFEIVFATLMLSSLLGECAVRSLQLYEYRPTIISFHYIIPSYPTITLP